MSIAFLRNKSDLYRYLHCIGAKRGLHPLCILEFFCRTFVLQDFLVKAGYHFGYEGFGPNNKVLFKKDFNDYLNSHELDKPPFHRRVPCFIFPVLNIVNFFNQFYPFQRDIIIWIQRFFTFCTITCFMLYVLKHIV